MKKITLILIVLLLSKIGLAQEQLALNSFRKVPADEFKTFMQNEAFYWSKVAKVLYEKDQIEGWAIMVRRAGAMATEPNVNTRIEIGTWVDYENLGKNYAAAEEIVKNQMDSEKRALLEETLKQDKFEFATILTKLNDVTFNVNDPGFNFLVFNYSKATNVDQYLSEESRIMKPFFKKLIQEGKTNMKGWASIRVLSPEGYDYPFNCFTVDFYENISDVFSPLNSDNITWPEEITSLDKLKTPGIWKRAIWQRVMYLNRKKELVMNL